MENCTNQLDIIIVNYKSTDLLRHCLHSLYESANGTQVRVFVLDNNSQDGVEGMIDIFPQIHLSINSRNEGFAKAVNEGIDKGSAPYILLLNPDTVVSWNFIGCILDYLNNNPEIGIVGPRILNRDGTVQGSARRFPTPFTALFGRGTLLTRLFPTNSFTRANILTTVSDGKTPISVDWVSGACMAIRREALEEVGCLDEDFFMYWEDADICRRIGDSGRKVVYYPNASVMHYVGGSSERKIFRSVFEFHKSSYLLFRKYASGLHCLLKPVAIAGLSFRLVILWIYHFLKFLGSDPLWEKGSHLFYTRLPPSSRLWRDRTPRQGDHRA